jgi:hypothetical protein
MHYLILLDWQPGVDREKQDAARARRAKWEYPDGIRPIVELWSAAGSPAVVFACEADDPAPIMELTAAWEELFTITASEAMTPEEGLRLGSDTLNDWHKEYRVPLSARQS